MGPPATGILQRALVNLKSAWRTISHSVRSGAAPDLRADLPDGDLVVLVQQMRECLEGRGGEVSSRARAAALGHSYLTLNDRGRRRFLHVLADDFGVDWTRLYAATRLMPETDSLEHGLETIKELRQILTPPRLKLLTQFNSLPSGVKFLVDLRGDLLRYIGADTRLRSLDLDLKGLLASWFDEGFLDLKRITWSSPAALLEKLIAYEAVHEIQSWDDLKNRLGEGRRCYAFFHPRMPDEPLIFVEVALVSEMSSSIQSLLDDASAERSSNTASTAIFYSISNTQRGLRGVNLGTFLIKRVADLLGSELPHLSGFATLSPIPGFGKYLRTRLREGAARSEVLSEMLSRPGWHRNPGVAAFLKEPLMKLCAHYLLEERVDGRTPDPVANFHLSNGARIDRINWLADVSEKGVEKSMGLMVNYRYELDEIEKNHEAYRSSGVAAGSRQVLSLLESTGQSTPDPRSG